MHKSQANFLSYKNMVTCERVEECEIRLELKRTFGNLRKRRKDSEFKNENMETMNVLKSYYRMRKNIAAHNHRRKGLLLRSYGGVSV